MKKWHILTEHVMRAADHDGRQETEAIIEALLRHRGLGDAKSVTTFVDPPHPTTLTPADVGIDPREVKKALKRVQKAIDAKESVVVYADYDADGITAGAILWETLWKLGARVMPYIPHRVDEGYGLSEKGIETVRQQHDPALIITVDHGITAYEKVKYAKKLGIDVIITDHHVKPDTVPDCITVHTTELSGSAVSWFLAKEILEGTANGAGHAFANELLSLATIGTVADLVPLVGPSRSIAKYGLEELRKTTRVGIVALLADAGVEQSGVDPYTISHMIAPRLNAMGRIEHALDALRLLCTRETLKARLLAQKLGLTNKERQQMTEDTVAHALGQLADAGWDGEGMAKKLIFLAHESYNQGIIGLVAGKLVERYYRPSIVLSRGEVYTKASARSVTGFNIVEAIRTASDLLVDVGGHPMAAGFTVETKNLDKLRDALESYAQQQITEELLQRVLTVDMEIPIEAVTVDLWKGLQKFQPFGTGNYEPVFVSRNVVVKESRLVGKEGKHLKLRISHPTSNNQQSAIDAIAFGLGSLSGQLKLGTIIDIAYAVDMNVWNGKRSLQLRVKDIHDTT